MNNQEIIRHGLEVIGILLVTLILAAPASSSSANGVTYINERMPLDYTTYNTCAPGNIPINLVGESVVQGKIFMDENGIRSTKGQSSIKATGLDANGIRYIVNGILNFNDKSSDGGPYTEVFIYSVISQGSTDNFFIKKLVHINQDGVVKSEFEAVCRG